MEALAAERDRAARAEAEAKAQLAEANARVAELAGKLASLAERQQAIAATPWWRRGRSSLERDNIDPNAPYNFTSGTRHYQR